jgi:sugar/nucleoside kinase (ribokinase family)
MRLCYEKSTCIVLLLRGFFPRKNIINVGGNALNVAVSCVKTGKADVALMGNIGTDIYAGEIIKTVDKHKIKRPCLRRQPHRKSFPGRRCFGLAQTFKNIIQNREKL